MNINNYIIHFYSENDVKLYTFNPIIEIEFGRKKNDVGALSVVLPNLDIYDLNDFNFNCKAEIYRDGKIIPVLWYLRKVIINDEIIELMFFDHITLLNQRYVKWYEVDGYQYPSHMRYEIDKLIYEIVRINYIDVEDDLGYVPIGIPTTVDNMTTDNIKINFNLLPVNDVGNVTESSFAWRKVLDVLKDLTNTAESNGENIWFDFIYEPNLNGINIGTLNFQIWYDIRNNDRRIDYSKDPVVFSPNLGNLTNYILEVDYEQYYNQVFVLAKELPEVDDGINLVRVVAYPEDYEFSGDDLIEYIETLNDEEINTDSMLSKAKTLLAEGNIKKKLTGDIVQLDDYQFFVHYEFGDKVSAYWNNYYFQTEISSYNVTVDEQETIRIPFEAE